MEKRQQSVADFLVELLPQYQRKVKRGNHFIDAKAATHLYSMWKDEKAQLSKNLFQKPSSLSESDLALMQEEGLIKRQGFKVAVTDKGQEIIRIMILGDDRSIFEDDGKDLDFKTASNNTNTPSKVKKQRQKAEDLWWGNLSI